jgi:hypothetical protein
MFLVWRDESLFVFANRVRRARIKYDRTVNSLQKQALGSYGTKWLLLT